MLRNIFLILPVRNLWNGIIFSHAQMRISFSLVQMRIRTNRLNENNESNYLRVEIRQKCQILGLWWEVLE